MEDFSNIIWVLLIAGSIIASIASKNKEEKRKKTTENTDNEAFPQEFQSEMPQKSPRLPLERTLQTASKPQPTKEFDGLTGELDAYRKHVEQHRTPKYPAAKPAVQSSSQSAMKAGAIAAEVTTDAQTPSEGIMSDFDLRKAVVWSEILKPKYDEE